MSFTQSVGQLRAPVATYSALPLSGNAQGDVRITLDVGVAYTWISLASSGDWVSWKKISVSNYTDLQGRPNSSPLAIDTATQAIRNIYLNYVYMFFINIVAISINVMKMFDGVLDSYITTDGVDLTRTTGAKKLLVASAQNFISYFRNNFDGSLDNYTKMLIHGRNGTTTLQSVPVGEGGGSGKGGGGDIYYTSFFDELYNVIIPWGTTVTDTAITKFGTKSFIFDGSQNNYLDLSYFNDNGDPFKVNGLDFTWEFWARPSTNNAETLLVDYSFNHSIGINFKIEKLIDKTVKVSVRGCTDYSWDNQWVPVNPISYDVTSVNTIEQNTWYHIAVVRQNGYLKLFINGNLEATSSVADTQNIVNYKNDMVLAMGYEEQAMRLGYGFNGRMEEIRFSKGIARYTASFTPQTVPFNTPTQVAPCNNMVLQSNGFQANAVPTSARIVVFTQSAVKNFDPQVIETVTPNTDIKVFVSRDGGTTFTQAADLKVEFNVYQEAVWSSIYNNTNFLIGTLDLSSQPNGKEIVYKITTHNNKDVLIRAVGINWK